MGNKEKAATLGMPHGTAASRLRKMLLFRQLKKHGENVCVRCSQVIELIEDLSVEHIKPWEGVSAELFWDLDNVSFSHTKCNRPHRNGPPPMYRPEGFNWCYRCKAMKPVEQFYKCAGRPLGLANSCIDCKTEWNEGRDRVQKFS